MAKTPQYPTAEAEYVQSPHGISLRDLAQKRKLSFNTIKYRSVRDEWVEKRRTFQHTLTTKANERALRQGEKAFAKDLEQEEQDLKEIRQLLVDRLNPKDLPGLDDAPGALRAAVMMPPLGASSYATLTGALIAVDKQLCLRRGMVGSEDGDGQLITLQITPLVMKEPKR